MIITEVLPHDVIEHILEKLVVKSLLKFKCVSKQWKSTIQSRAFQERQLMHRRQTGNPDVLLVSVFESDVVFEAMRTLVVGSSVSVKIPTSWEDTLYKVCKSNCDGLICLYNDYVPNVVVNPTTRWHRTLPLSSYQLLIDKLGQLSLASPGFGKDKINGTYKPVWLYNSAELDGLNWLYNSAELDGLNDDTNNNATICQVFDFTTNAWRYVVPASPYRILPYHDPVYLDGSLHWFTEGKTTNVLSFDLHTETFQVISKTPFLHHHYHSNRELVMCNLDDRLCVSEKKWPSQVIWSFDSDQKTWNKLYSIDLNITYSWFGYHRVALTPLAVVDKDKILFCEPKSGDPLLLTHDPNTKSYDIAYRSYLRTTAYPLCYFQSLISIL